MVSPVSGHVFEKRLIEKYISENGTDPLNGEKLQMDMLIDIKSESELKCVASVVFIEFIVIHSDKRVTETQTKPKKIFSRFV